MLGIQLPGINLLLGTDNEGDGEGTLGYGGSRKVERTLADEGAHGPEGSTGGFTASETRVQDDLGPCAAVTADGAQGAMPTDERARRMERIRLRPSPPRRTSRHDPLPFDSGPVSAFAGVPQPFSAEIIA